MTIKMTRELPTEPGNYFWTSCDYDPRIFTVRLDDDLRVCKPEIGSPKAAATFYFARDLGGYWAKVDQSQFEFED